MNEPSSGCIGCAVLFVGSLLFCAVAAVLFPAKPENAPRPPAPMVAPSTAPADAAPLDPPGYVLLDMAEEDARRFAGRCRGCRAELVGLDLTIRAADCSPDAFGRFMRDLHGISLLRSVDCASPRHHRHVDLSPP